MAFTIKRTIQNESSISFLAPTKGLKHPLLICQIAIIKKKRKHKESNPWVLVPELSLINCMYTFG